MPRSELCSATGVKRFKIASGRDFKSVVFKFPNGKFKSVWWMP